MTLTISGLSYSTFAKSSTLLSSLQEAVAGLLDVSSSLVTSPVVISAASSPLQVVVTFESSSDYDAATTAEMINDNTEDLFSTFMAVAKKGGYTGDLSGLSVVGVVTSTLSPTAVPTASPSVSPTVIPSVRPSAAPSASPSIVPTVSPSVLPSHAPTTFPSSKNTTNMLLFTTTGLSLSELDSPTLIFAFRVTVASFTHQSMSDVEFVSLFSLYSGTVDSTYFDCMCSSSNLPVQVSTSVMVEMQLTSHYSGQSVEDKINGAISEFNVAFKTCAISKGYDLSLTSFTVINFIIYNKL